MLEVELKVRVSSLEPVRKLLLEKGAVCSGRIHEHDIYYNAPHRDFGQTDEAVRVRYTNNHAVVTYKGAKIKKFGLKAREELNTAVESGEVFETMLDRLGFTKTTEVNKWRENYKFSGSAISLDEVDELGTFVEIEIMAEDENTNAAVLIEKIAKEIGVSGEPLLASYLELLLSKRSAVQS
ncbi:MAG: class IV adenylate cyclase [Methanomicrobiales archaeon HGW-Methanomicrobiales-1]|jgi:adenylate cyclase class 2|nr:MAG: class IV adenylate cyclase [Methanomicrobiales archaeon HGW-Methanomicrobiales-1]